MLKYKLIYISNQRNSGNRTPEDAMILFFGLHLIFGINWTSKDKKTFFWSSPILQWKRKQEVASPHFEISGHAPAGAQLLILQRAVAVNIDCSLINSYCCNINSATWKNALRFRGQNRGKEGELMRLAATEED